MTEYAQLQPLSFGSTSNAWDMSSISSMSNSYLPSIQYFASEWNPSFSLAGCSYMDFPGEILEPQPIMPPVRQEQPQDEEYDEVCEEVEENVSPKPLPCIPKHSRRLEEKKSKVLRERFVQDEESPKNNKRGTKQVKNKYNGRKAYTHQKTATLPFALVAGIALHNFRMPVPVYRIYDFVEEHLPGIANESDSWQKSIRSNLASCPFYKTIDRTHGETKNKWTFASVEAMHNFFDKLKLWMSEHPDVKFYGAASTEDWQDIVAGVKTVNKLDKYSSEDDHVQNTSRKSVRLGQQYEQASAHCIRQKSASGHPSSFPYLIPGSKQKTPSILAKKSRTQSLTPVGNVAQVPPVMDIYNNPSMLNLYPVVLDPNNVLL